MWPRIEGADKRSFFDHNARQGESLAKTSEFAARAGIEFQDINEPHGTMDVMQICSGSWVLPSSPSSHQLGFDGLISFMQSVQIKPEFEELAKCWLEDTALDADPARIESNKYFLRIVQMGEKAIPHILEEVRNKTGWWFGVLEKIVDSSPVKKEHYGIYELMESDWIEWGMEQGFVVKIH